MYVDLISNQSYTFIGPSGVKYSIKKGKPVEVIHPRDLDFILGKKNVFFQTDKTGSVKQIEFVDKSDSLSRLSIDKARNVSGVKVRAVEPKKVQPKSFTKLTKDGALIKSAPEVKSVKPISFVKIDDIIEEKEVLTKSEAVEVKALIACPECGKMLKKIAAVSSHMVRAHGKKVGIDELRKLISESI